MNPPPENQSKQARKRKAGVAFTEEKILQTPELTSLKRARSENVAGAPGPALTKPPVLPDLLDCTSLKDQAAIEARFHLIARSLLCEHVLVVKPAVDAPEMEYELLEVEFYLLSAGYHEDPFTHGTEEQRTSGKWYFHKAPRRSGTPAISSSSKSAAGNSPAGGYRGGTRKGLDLTMGGPLLSPHFQQAASSQTAGPRGGVLLRSMRRVGMSSVISGPSLLVDEVLRASGGAASILELVQSKLGGDTDAFSSRLSSSKSAVQLYLRPRSKHVETSIYTSPRIGLDLSNPVTKALSTDPRVVFVQKPYRYFVHPTLLTANGRSQTFLGVYLSSSSSLRARSQLLDEVARITGLKRTVVDKYAEEFTLGRERGKLKDFVGAAGKGVCSKPALYLKMMGTLAAATE